MMMWLRSGGASLSFDLSPHLHCMQPQHHAWPVSMSKPTANWEKVGDKFYRKIQLYTAVFDTDLELENYNVAGAPYSGAVGRYAAMMQDGQHSARQ